MTWWRSEGDAVVLDLHVQPGATRSEVAGLHDGRLKLRLKARAIEGEANAALIEFLAERLGVAKRDVIIEAGVTSRRKRVRLRAARLPPDALLA